MALEAKIVSVTPDDRYDGSLTATVEYYDVSTPTLTLYVHVFSWLSTITAAAARAEVVLVGQQFHARRQKAVAQATKWVGTTVAIAGT